MIQKEDLIFLHGGGNLGTLYPTEDRLRVCILKNFPENRIIIFPQSIYFGNDDAGQAAEREMAAAFAAHPRCVLMARDEVSYTEALRAFPAAHPLLMPDVVMSRYGKRTVSGAPREGVLLLLRNDGEKALPDAKAKEIKAWLRAKGIPYAASDTMLSRDILPEAREEEIEKKLREIERYRLVITDRFHGVIFSFLTGTPALVFKSFDTKISSGIKWFKAFSWIRYAKADEDLRTIADWLEAQLGDESQRQGTDRFRDMFKEALEEIVGE